MKNADDMLKSLAEKMESMSAEEFFKIYDSIDVDKEVCKSYQGVEKMLFKRGRKNKMLRLENKLKQICQIEKKNLFSYYIPGLFYSAIFIYAIQFNMFYGGILNIINKVSNSSKDS